ncbi:MAG TPA: YdcF family protein [Puia sp.]|nr:YdcF family protein [Puia sp.]
MKIRLNKKIKIFLYFIVAWFALHSIYICYDGLHNYKGNADVEIVLGNEVYADSSVSLPLKGRLDKALELYKNKRVKKIFVSGGRGDNGVAEGDAMKSYLIKKNVPPIDITADNNGRNTYFTAKDFIALNDSMHFTSAIAVTSFYHITRTKYIIRKLGFKNVEGVSSDAIFLSKDWMGIIREFFAFYKYLIFY